jgi:hypothetical protein
MPPVLRSRSKKTPKKTPKNSLLGGGNYIDMTNASDPIGGIYFQKRKMKKTPAKKNTLKKKTPYPLPSPSPLKKNPSPVSDKDFEFFN